MIEMSIPILEMLEPFVEVLNLVLAILAVGFGIRIYSLLKGELKTTWKFLLFAIGFFGLHEVVGSLAEFGVFEIEGLYAFTELFFIIALFVAIFKVKSILSKLIVAKK